MAAAAARERPRERPPGRATRIDLLRRGAIKDDAGPRRRRWIPVPDPTRGPAEAAPAARDGGINALSTIEATSRGRRPLLLPALVFVATLAGGCSEMTGLGARLGFVPMDPAMATEGTVALQPLAPVRRDIFTRSYRIGETYTARTGEAVVSIKNYSITERVGRATVLRDFAQTCRGFLGRRTTLCDSQPLEAVRGALGGVNDVVAAVTLSDGQYFAVALPSDGRSQVYLLVDTTGRLRRGAYVAWRENMSPGMTLGRVPLVELEPDVALDSDSPLFSFESVERFVFMGPGYLSFDLVFTGTRDTVRGELYTFSYREFGRDSTDRPAFERSLQFPVSEPVIEVGPVRIEVEPIGYEQLRFRVIGDGQPPPTER